MRVQPRFAFGLRLLPLAACLLLQVPARAVDTLPTPTPIAALRLNDGRLLHNVEVKSNESTSIVVRADEGLLKIAKSNLPQAMADAYPVKPAPSTGPDTVM